MYAGTLTTRASIPNPQSLIPNLQSMLAGIGNPKDPQPFLNAERLGPARDITSLTHAVTGHLIQNITQRRAQRLSAVIERAAHQCSKPANLVAVRKW